MTVLQTILAAVSLLLPGPGAGVHAAGLERSVSPLTVTFDNPCGVIQRRTDLPTPAGLCLESLDETALDEEDSDEIDNSSITSQVVFGENTFPTVLLDPSSPRRLHAQTQTAHSILRC